MRSATWLLDTNVVSEASRSTPHPGVMSNLIRYEGELAIAAPVWHELRFGWLRMPAGQRRDAIGHFVQDVAGQLPVLSLTGPRWSPANTRDFAGLTGLRMVDWFED